MRQRPALIRVRVTLPPADYRVYISAARILARIIGGSAPAVGTIIQAQLGGRKPSSIAEDHLDAVDWPLNGTKRIGRPANSMGTKNGKLEMRKNSRYRARDRDRRGNFGNTVSSVYPPFISNETARQPFLDTTCDASV
jgi:hypothetical protein